MSQIKKLLFGETIPKAQEGYKFNLDGQDIYYSDDDLKEIGDRIAALDNNYKRFLGNAVAAIKGGNQSGNRASNTISMDQLSGLSAKDLKRLSKNGSYWETISGKDSYHAREAISAYLNILNSVANKPKKEEEPSKPEIDATELVLDYNTKDGKKYLSPTHGNNIAAKNRVTTILQHLKDGENSKYSASKYNTDVISSWLNSLSGDDKYTAAQNYFNGLWADMSSGNYKYDEDVEDLLGNFGIKYGLTAPTPPAAPKPKSGVETEKPVGNTVAIGTRRTGEDGKTYIVTGIGDDKKPIWEEYVEKPETNGAKEQQPQQTAAIRLITPGERSDMDWGVEYEGRPYSYESIQPGSKLDMIMKQFAQNNAELLSQGERYNRNLSLNIKTPDITNFSDWSAGQLLDDGTNLNQFFLDRGITSAAVSEIGTDANGNRYFKYYDNYTPGGEYLPHGSNTYAQNPWNIRSPFYLRIDNSGNIVSVNESELSGIQEQLNKAPRYKNMQQNINEAATINPKKNYTQSIDFQAFNNKDVRRHVPGTEIYRYQDKRGKTHIIYLTDNGLISDMGEKLNLEALRLLLRTNKATEKKKNKINPKKVELFTAKNGGILKGQDGLPKIQLKYPHSVERRIEQRPDGTTVAVEEIHDNYGNITINEKEISNAEQPAQQPEKAEEPKQEEQTKQEPIVVVQKPAEVIAKKAPENSTEYKRMWVEPKQLPIVNVPNVPLAKQKIAPIKGTKKYDLNDLVEVLGRLADQKQYIAKGGKVKKAQNPDDEVFGKSGPINFYQDEEYDPLGMFTDPTQREVYVKSGPLAIAEQQTGNSGAGDLNQVATKSGNTENVTTQPSDLGNYNFNIPSTYKYLSPAISAGRFLTTSLFQKKYYDAAKDMLNAGRFNEMAVWANAPSTNMPVLDRQLQQVNRERMIGVKPVTSNFIDNFAAANTRENQLWARENDIYAKQSAQYQDIKKQITDIQNQNLANSIATRNQNIARQKAIDSAIKQQYLEFLQRHAQSVENLGLEFQNNVTNDINYMNNYNQFKFEDAQQKNFDKYIDGLFPNYRAMYNQLDYDKRVKYSDFLDYMEKVHPDKYNPKMEEITNRQRQDQEALLEWQRRNKLNYWYPKALFGIKSSAGIDRMKKGGRVNGNTRYTLEPDERIWIENNKATHRAIGKLSDNTIKLLLKALK